ncbi:unnamed protein product [Moneuplotes crassus]|uniref:Tubulin-specific chaperone A n=1 Tax=Euplotes crassus TaxID=5936 RepID=A0AAD2D9W8_EUPCR|nr:unnamed protein product [Moneuplotes crassus]|mmetsp:Transcript_9745/g.9579  ORF Transcript_9745/g.9579 Transcript_9745/m.9579 type:complete len:115 (-) Transcript_9745:46-390(-)|eukprot:CAMPEP_0197009290 /NCGR_PEP_ID=MMETSP1380-20130617/49431_1 /TAXON_ID=5936 /ORGANISM="Euplotes crassus, Strain CT5" /LENGTH=114 /DNA_ID=CAMNT_0042430433 /DNA_START=25 /DNA_END=369 /DNA_ORIENTATION=-
MDKATARQIKIKTGVLKRSVKDYSYYQEEAKKEEEKLDKLKEDEAEEHDITQQTNVMQESLDMLPHCKAKIESALEDLKGVIADHEDTDEFKDSEEGQTAVGLITEASAFLEGL